MDNNNTLLTPQKNVLDGLEDANSITKITFVDVLYDRMGFSRSEAQAVVDAIFDEILAALVKGCDVKLSNFGTFCTHDKKARPGRNPKTGQPYEISARRVVTFVPSPVMREAVAKSKTATKTR